MKCRFKSTEGVDMKIMKHNGYERTDIEVQSVIWAAHKISDRHSNRLRFFNRSSHWRRVVIWSISEMSMTAWGDPTSDHNRDKKISVFRNTLSGVIRQIHKLKKLVMKLSVVDMRYYWWKEIKWLTSTRHHSTCTQ